MPLSEEEKKEQERLKKKYSKLSEYQKKRTLWINLIPLKARKRFMEFADDEFEGHWGMALKHLQDFRDGIMQDPNEVLTARIDVLEQRVKHLENLGIKKPEKEKVVVAADGTKKRIG